MRRALLLGLLVSGCAPAHSISGHVHMITPDGGDKGPLSGVLVLATVPPTDEDPQWWVSMDETDDQGRYNLFELTGPNAGPGRGLEPGREYRLEVRDESGRLLLESFEHPGGRMELELRVPGAGASRER